MEASTVDNVTEAYSTHGSYRKTAKALGVSHAAIWNIINGRAQDVSRETENKVRSALGMAPLPCMVLVETCPDCLDVHTGRCNGKQVTLRPVRGRREPSRIVEYANSELARMVKERVEI